MFLLLCNNQTNLISLKKKGLNRKNQRWRTIHISHRHLYRKKISCKKLDNLKSNNLNINLYGPKKEEERLYQIIKIFFIFEYYIFWWYYYIYNIIGVFNHTHTL